MTLLYTAPIGVQNASDPIRQQDRTSYQALLRLRNKEVRNAVDVVQDGVGPGPMSLLKCAADGQKAVVVVTRHRRGIRGASTGLLLAYDKYMNLVLRDVVEEYTVREAVQRPRASNPEQTRSGFKLVKKKRSLKQVFVTGMSVVHVRVA
ncbi:hypothetical protein H632_c353p1 [Helicosporidium sp. ATCC 50920]|nr:hypothetical protein H632_c353p1 [Helicosporidium sp. ATCC 50920]|eukprot:KDD76106.1 hypothetical protein H632_c353p1 [Helicosporidium sp. ATCC 50920]